MDNNVEETIDFSMKRSEALKLKGTDYRLYELVMTLQHKKLEGDYCETLDKKKLARECELGYFEITDLFDKAQILRAATSYPMPIIGKEGVRIMEKAMWSGVDLRSREDIADPIQTAKEIGEKLRERFPHKALIEAVKEGKNIFIEISKEQFNETQDILYLVGCDFTQYKERISCSSVNVVLYISNGQADGWDLSNGRCSRFDHFQEYFVASQSFEKPLDQVIKSINSDISRALQSPSVEHLALREAIERGDVVEIKVTKDQKVPVQEFMIAMGIGWRDDGLNVHKDCLEFISVGCDGLKEMTHWSASDYESEGKTRARYDFELAKFVGEEVKEKTLDEYMADFTEGKENDNGEIITSINTDCGSGQSKIFFRNKQNAIRSLMIDI